MIDMSLLNYFLFGGSNDLEEQGVGYFWLIAEISRLKVESILFSSNFVNPVLNFEFILAILFFI